METIKRFLNWLFGLIETEQEPIRQTQYPREEIEREKRMEQFSREDKEWRKNNPQEEIGLKGY